MRTNVAEKALIYTREGALAVFLNPVDQLRRSVMACMLWEDGFYEDGQSIADRIRGEIVEVLKQKNGADIVANIAYECRTKFKLRHVPMLLLVSLIQARTKESAAVVAGAISYVIQRPDELGELVSLYWNEKKQPLSAQMKKGLATAFQKFDAYALKKYDGANARVKLRDVLFLVHGKPKDEEQAEVYKKLANKTLESPDTWEVALSAGAEKKETFTRLIKEKKLGALALLRNLRNMLQADVDSGLIRQALVEMKSERVLPFRFITVARYAPTLEPELERAMFKCLEGVDKLPGKTVLVVDNSGSMTTGTVSRKSELRPVDAACALAMLLREVCEEVQIVVFGSTAGLIAPRRGFALRDAIVTSKHSGGTNTAIALQVAASEGYDRCIVITDEQSHQSISGPQGKWGYFINVSHNKNGIGYKEWVHIDGWSEAVVNYIFHYEQLKSE